MAHTMTSQNIDLSSWDTLYNAGPSTLNTIERKRLYAIFRLDAADHFVRHLGLQTIHYLLTPWCRVLLEKLTGLQLVKEFPAFHGTWRFVTALTSVRHLSLSWASPIQSIYPHTTYRPFITPRKLPYAPATLGRCHQVRYHLPAVHCSYVHWVVVAT